MNLEEIKAALVKWGKQLQNDDPQFKAVREQAYHVNQWFIPEYIQKSLDNIIQNFLQPQKLDQWTEMYPNLQLPEVSKTVGIVMAGNIPLVGFHDLLAILITGNKARIKLSSKDPLLLPFVVQKLAEVSPKLAERIEFAENLKNIDAIIATGSNNTSRYFEYYFSKYPNIIRKNRASVAVLSGEETAEQIKALGEDIFTYFGLGCRNIAKIYVPTFFDIPQFIERLEVFGDIKEYKKYKNNFDFNLTMLLMNKVHHYASEYIILEKNDAIASPVATLYYEYYEDLNDLQQKLEFNKDQIQITISDMELPVEKVSLGQAQQPQLWDYADKVDVVEFLIGLR